MLHIPKWLKKKIFQRACPQPAATHTFSNHSPRCFSSSFPKQKAEITFEGFSPDKQVCNSFKYILGIIILNYRKLVRDKGVRISLKG